MKKTATKDRVGVGVLVQIMGVAAIAGGVYLAPRFNDLVLGIIIIIVGVAALFAGGVIARQKKHICGGCGNEVSDTSKICPTCNEKFE